MQPAAVSNGAGLTVVKNRGPRVGGDDAVGAGYVNDEKFWTKKVQDVPADQVSHFEYMCDSPFLILRSPSSYSSTNTSTLKSTSRRQSKLKPPRGRRARGETLSSVLLTTRKRKRASAVLMKLAHRVASRPSRRSRWRRTRRAIRKRQRSGR